MRSISSVRTVMSIGTVTSSFRIPMSRSCSCSTMTSLTSVNSCLQKGIVNPVLDVWQCDEQRRERQKSFLTQKRLLCDLHLGRTRQQHPQRNLETPPRWIADRDRAVSLLRSADNLKSGTMERMELIEDLDVRGFCAQGTVGAGGTILISTVWSQLGESRRTVLAGSLAALSSSCR
jgi:hypothetical protein